MRGMRPLSRRGGLLAKGIENVDRILVHGTSHANARKIQLKGILPGTETGKSPNPNAAVVWIGREIAAISSQRPAHYLKALIASLKHPVRMALDKSNANENISLVLADYRRLPKKIRQTMRGHIIKKVPPRAILGQVVVQRKEIKEISRQLEHSGLYRKDPEKRRKRLEQKLQHLFFVRAQNLLREKRFL